MIVNDVILPPEIFAVADAIPVIPIPGVSIVTLGLDVYPDPALTRFNVDIVLAIDTVAVAIPEVNTSFEMISTTLLLLM